MKSWTALLVLAAAAAMPALAADLPPGDCGRPAAATDLSACDLIRARLSGRDLRGARFAGADFRDADLFHATFDDPDLSDVRLGNSTGSLWIPGC